jgi:hypothetical protein
VAPGRLLPVLLLLGYGVAFGAAAFGLATPAFDDHPGQLFRLHHLVARGPAPWAWNPDWWAGYPELQFYPPGYFYLGALLVWGSLGMLSVAGAYQALLWLTWLAPGVTAFLALARLSGREWLALPGAFLALTLSAGVASGVEGGVHIGMLPARLGWALLALLVLSRPSLTPPLLAGLVLLHPAHGPAGIVLVLAAAWLGGRPRGRRLIDAALALLLAAMLTAFWAVPLVARLEHTRALAWGALAPLETLSHHPLLLVLLALAAAAWPLARTPAERLVAVWPWLGVGLVAADAAGLEPLGIQWLPADRVSDSAWMAIVLAAGFTVARLLERLGAGVGAPAAAGALACALFAVALSWPAHTLVLWPRAAEWPSEAVVERGLRLDALWAAVRRGPDGRVLFVRSGVPLVYGPEWWRPHTHVTALAPIRTGRAILNGTFTHPSPIAALVYRGDAGAGAITTLVERLDGRRLFGRSLEDLDAATLAAYADRLGAAVVVALDEDAPRLRALADTRVFRARPPVGPFLLFDRIEPVSLPALRADGHGWMAATGGAGDWIPARMAYYPLWRAVQADAPLETRRGPYGDLEIRLGPSSGPVTLVYAPGAPEIAGVVLSAAGLAGWLVWRRRGLIR